MPGEGILLVGGEDADAVVGARIGGRQQERRFRKPQPLRQLQHISVRHTLCCVNHTQRIAKKPSRTENIHQIEIHFQSAFCQFRSC